MESALEQMINIVDIVVGLKAMYVEFRACKTRLRSSSIANFSRAAGA
jgi:hypothetical protein